LNGYEADTSEPSSYTVDLATGSRRGVVKTDIAASKDCDEDIAMDSVHVRPHQVQEVEVECERSPFDYSWGDQAVKTR